MNKNINTLLKGFEKFKKNYLDQDNFDFKKLVNDGQKPKALVIACSDSRVDPILLLNCQPGDLFVIRNVANLVPSYESDNQFNHGIGAALEFGINVLEIPHIIVLGHTQCGGIQSLLKQSSTNYTEKSFLTKWMELATPALEPILKYHAQDCEESKTILCGQYSLKNSLKNLATFPWVAEKINQNKLQTHAWNFHMSLGVLEVYDVKQDIFKTIEIV